MLKIMNAINEILESVDSMSVDDKLSITEIIKKRAIEQSRQEIRQNADLSYKEYAEGKIKSQSIEDFIKDVNS